MKKTASQALLCLLLALCFVVLPYDCSLIFARQRAEKAASEADVLKFGPCFEFTDPTRETYADTPELALLKDADPQAAAYFVQNGAAFTLLNETDTAQCFRPSYSFTPIHSSDIFLNKDRLTTPASRAVALSHEMVHVQHNDPNSAMGKHSLLRHLWMTEEGEAHWRGLQTARALHQQPKDNPWKEYLGVIFVLPLSYILFIATGIWFDLQVRQERRKKRQTAA